MLNFFLTAGVYRASFGNRPCLRAGLCSVTFDLNRMRKTTAFFLLFFVFQLVVGSQTLDDKLKEIDAYANNVIATHRGPGMAIAIVKDDKVAFAKGYGVRELGKNEPVDENTVFAIASNSKAFKAPSLANLV